MDKLTPYAVEGRYAIMHDDLHDIDDMLAKSELFLAQVCETVSMQVQK